MTANKSSLIAVLLAFALGSGAVAQETPTPAPSPPQPETPLPTPTPTLSPAREVRIRFVPPPMEGTISLGIFDEQGKLVRVLHREANIDNFNVEEDSLSTSWDGKNDAGEDAVSGKYRARGCTVGTLKVDEIGAVQSNSGSERVNVKLMENPLVNGRQRNVDLAVGSDAAGTFLKTADGLPLFTVSKTPNALTTSIAKSGKRTVDVWLSDGTTITQFRVSDVDQIMEFDCGTFDLR